MSADDLITMIRLLNRNYAITHVHVRLLCDGDCADCGVTQMNEIVCFVLRLTLSRYIDGN